MKKTSPSLIIITKNCATTLEVTLKSVANLVEEIILIDDNSIDRTLDIARQYQAMIFNYSGSFSQRKSFALQQAKGEWILNLDSDESLSKRLVNEINLVTSHQPPISGYFIPYQNHFLGRKINFGGENYAMLRLFKKEAVIMSENIIHENFQLKKGEIIGKLKQKINHYSYRSLGQVLNKFTVYARLEAKRKKSQGEKTSLKKIFIYPLHLFWARFFKDKGYQDGLFRLPLDLSFAYLEFLTYFLMLFK